MFIYPFALSVRNIEALIRLKIADIYTFCQLVIFERSCELEVAVEANTRKTIFLVGHQCTINRQMSKSPTGGIQGVPQIEVLALVVATELNRKLANTSLGGYGPRDPFIIIEVLTTQDVTRTLLFFEIFSNGCHHEKVLQDRQIKCGFLLFNVDWVSSQQSYVILHICKCGLVDSFRILNSVFLVTGFA